MTILPTGKLPSELLAKIISQNLRRDPRLLLGPGIGLDCAVIDMGTILLVLKSDPITFATDEIGWYAVQVNANDIATTGATPRWFLNTLLLPENKTTPELVEKISTQIYLSCQEIGVTIIGGHAEITYDLNRPILIGTMIGEVDREALVTPRGARPGDSVLLTKGVPIEATTILAREFSDQLRDVLSPEEMEQANNFLYNPGISILRDVKIALSTGRVTAMHDPTEGGLAAALWELATASEMALYIDPSAVHIPLLSQRICQSLLIDPLAAIASGALLLTAPPEDCTNILLALEQEGIPCMEIGYIEPGPAAVWCKITEGWEPLPWPERDEIARLYENQASAC